MLIFCLYLCVCVKVLQCYMQYIESRCVTFVRAGLTVDRFVTIMLSKMSARDEDDYIRWMFLAFDMQCMYITVPAVMTMPFSR